MHPFAQEKHASIVAGRNQADPFKEKPIHFIAFAGVTRNHVLCVAAAVYMIAPAPARGLQSAVSAATTIRAEESPANRGSLPYYYFPSQCPAPIGSVDEPAPTF